MKITEETMKQLREQGASPADFSGRPDTGAAADIPDAAQAPKSDAPQLTEREKLHQMNRQDRIWYIWTYYKLHFIIAIVVVILAGVVGHSIYRSTFRTALHCIYVNSRSETGADMTPLEEGFAEYLQLGKKDEILAETAFISYEEAATNYSYANMAKIAALVSAKDLDILICDTETLDHYASLDGFADLEDLLPADILALVSDRLYRCSGDDGTVRAYAIDLSGTAFAAQSGLAQTPPLLGVITTTERIENAEALIRYIFEP